MFKLIIFGSASLLPVGMHSPSLIKGSRTPKIWNFSSLRWVQPCWSFCWCILTIPTIISVDLSGLATHHSHGEIKQTFLPASYFQGSWFADLLSTLLEHLHCSAADEPNSLANQVEPINNSVQEHLHGYQFHPHIMPISTSSDELTNTSLFGDVAHLPWSAFLLFPED